MNQCLRCNKQCSVASLFCDECRALVGRQINSSAPGQPAHMERDVSILSTSPHVAHRAIPPSRYDGAASGGNDDIVNRMTAPNPVVPSPPFRLSQSSLYSMQANRVEQALHKLNDAARRIAAAEPGDHRKPRNARLSPLRDISPEIQRHSTPMPQVPGQKLFSIDNVQNDDLGGSLPDLWPWLHDSDSDEIDGDSWSNRTDPLISRRFPDSVEAARIEEEDMQRVAAEDLATFSLPTSRKKVSRLRLAFATLAVLAILALTIDSILVSVAFLNKRSVPSITSGPPTLILSSTTVRYGQNVWLRIRHFTSSSEVYITRDVEEAIQLNVSNATVGPTRSMIRVNSHGDADVSMYIENTWDPGFHTIEAEDIQTRYTASTSLHIDDAGPTRPPHLVVDDLTIDLGAEPVGANSIRPLRMHNAGSGSIIWSASSSQPWLLLAPNQGTFSDNQTISVGGERANLKPGDYKGTITVSSNVGVSVDVQVIMTVRPLPANAGPVLQVTPVLLSFVATDGGANPAPQYLEVSNPGSQPMHWSLSNNAPPSQSQGTFLNSLGSSVNWLSTDQTSGSVAPGAKAIVRVSAQSRSLLPGAYIDTIMFTADQGAINSPQGINISLTVQSQCSLQLNTNMLSFTAVQGQSNPNTQAVSLAASASCPATTNWNTTSSAHWLTVTPGNGQLKGVVSATATVSVNSTGLSAGSYSGIITVTTAQNTQAVQVQLTVQPPLPPGAPVLSISPMNVNFSVNQGQPNPPGQVISITNTGGSPLYWRGAANMLAGSVAVAVVPSGGIIAPRQTGQAIVNAKTLGAPAGSYTGQISISGSDASGNNAGGSPLSIMANVSVQAPCTLAPPSSSSLAFTATQGGGDPVPQGFVLTASGNCAGAVGWKVSQALPSWLNLSSSSGSFRPNGQSVTLNVAPTIAGLSPGTYTAQVPIAATDSSNQPLVGSPLSFTVSLTVQPPCALQASASRLTFSTAQGQSPASQVLGVSENGACSRPVAWADTSNSSWLVLSVPSGLDNGSGGSIGVSINTSGLLPGTYSGMIALSASGSGGGAVQGSPQTVPVTLIVTGFTIGGSVNACADSTCSTSVPLVGAIVTLIDSNGKSFTAVTSSTGSYTFSNVVLGTCTLSVSGDNGTTTHYAGTASLTVAGNQTNVTINAVPS